MGFVAWFAQTLLSSPGQAGRRQSCLWRLIASLAMTDSTIPAIIRGSCAWRSGATKRPRPRSFAMAAFPIPSKTLYGAARFDIGEAI
jgi:hypothetical protein